ncbi:MAG TPA: hypothetical protein VHG72_22350 [Polyangia bacterium]|nr:hypothetical protein [Polyangia bacterium]
MANNEIVWTSTPDNAAFTISRASSNGLNERTVTSIQFPDSHWQFNNNGFLSGRADRIFYHHFDLTADTDVLYYVSTNAVNAAGVQIAALQNIGLGLPIAAPPDLANDTIFLGNEYSSSTSDYLVLGIPLPNGVLSGTPPTFMDGYVCSGVVDEANFYGTICDNAMVPQDAVVECPLSNCSAPTIIARGQASAINFADDATAIYWTTSGQGSNVAIWKAAK